mmetsp:Transcript_35864/g.82328  ORF Transcript_35864/g.82328 Transcript_35864/m.82328 type:complete len:167 (-) Transcript_35864:32-532(-)
MGCAPTSKNQVSVKLAGEWKESSPASLTKFSVSSPSHARVEKVASSALSFNSTCAGTSTPQPLSIGSSMTLSNTRAEYYQTAAAGKAHVRLNPDYSTTDAYIAVLNKFLQAVETHPEALVERVHTMRARSEWSLGVLEHDVWRMETERTVGRYQERGSSPRVRVHL